jgi:hypothetical protein
LEKLRDRVAGSKLFSSMDLRDRFYNILVKEEVLPMGLSNSPASMQVTMNRIFGIYYDIGLLVYLDDLLVYSEDSKTHLNNLKILFSLLRKHKLYLKREKCKFLVPSVRFCGHNFSSKALSMIEDIKELKLLPGV